MKKISKVLLPLILMLSSSHVMSADVYRVNVTRKDSDLYKVEYKNMYIQTRYCYEYVYYDDAILKIDNPYGFNIGKIYFSNGNSCDVQKIIG